MPSVNLASAAALTGLHQRTLRRWLASGELSRAAAGGDGRTRISLASLRAHIPLTLEADDVAVLLEADAGAAEAQNHLALLFLQARHPALALPWLHLAAAQAHADAMHWLARCSLEGAGLPRDAHVALMWLARSAAGGHVLSAALLASIVGPTKRGSVSRAAG